MADCTLMLLLLAQQPFFAPQESKGAVDSLMEAANQLQKAHHAFADKLMGRTDVPEHHSVDQFFQTVKAAADVQVYTCMICANIRGCKRAEREDWWQAIL